MSALDSRLDYAEIERILGSISSTLGAAESHGLLCGLLCANPTQRAKARWFTELLDSAGLEAGQLEAHAGSLQQLDALFEASVSEINSADMGFELLLPLDSESLSSRTSALAGWCSGFCAGVGLAAGNERKLPEDTQELLADFSAISRADEEELDPDEDENTLVELIEYVRMGALLVNEELQPAPTPPNSPPNSVH